MRPEGHARQAASRMGNLPHQEQPTTQRMRADADAGGGSLRFLRPGECRLASICPDHASARPVDTAPDGIDTSCPVSGQITGWKRDAGATEAAKRRWRTRRCGKQRRDPRNHRWDAFSAWRFWPGTRQLATRTTGSARQGMTDPSINERPILALCKDRAFRYALLLRVWSTLCPDGHARMRARNPGRPHGCRLPAE